MRRSPVALVPAAVGLLLAACVGDRDTTAPRVAASDSASFDRAMTPAQQRPPATITIRKDAHAFFTSSSRCRSSPISQRWRMRTALRRTTHPAAATPFGLNIFAHIAAARQTSSPEDGHHTGRGRQHSLTTWRRA